MIKRLSLEMGLIGYRIYIVKYSARVHMAKDPRACECVSARIIHNINSITFSLIYRPVARYGLPPPPRRGNFVYHDFLKASCLARFLQHVSPRAMEVLLSNSPLHMLPIQRHKFNIKRTEVRIRVNIRRCSIKCYFI